MRKLFAALIVSLGTMAPAWAGNFVVDKDHAQVTFSADHLGFSTVHGQFRDFEAEIDFFPGNIEATRVMFVIDSASVDTFSTARDKSLRSKKFLNTDAYPNITFQTTSVVPTGTDTADITGDLTIIGVTQPITMQARLNKYGPSPFDPKKVIAGFTISGEIDRRAFGMNFAAPAVGAVIPIRIDLEMSPAS